jgi:hypothetical protein
MWGLLPLSAPDIYGIIVDTERGSKPHIFSRQEILRDAVSPFNPNNNSNRNSCNWVSCF